MFAVLRSNIIEEDVVSVSIIVRLIRQECEAAFNWAKYRSA